MCLVGVVSRKRVWLVGIIYGCDYQVCVSRSIHRSDVLIFHITYVF